MNSTLTAVAFVMGLAEGSFVAKMMRDKGVDTVEEFITHATLEEVLRVQAHAQLAILLWGVAAILSVMRL